jgi:hypothetical protein
MDSEPLFDSVADVIARTIGFQPGVDGLIGSGLSRILAYNRAADIAKALGIAPTLSADTLRRWGSGEVIHLGPDSPKGGN